jgi:hypothetical protein
MQSSADTFRAEQEATEPAKVFVPFGLTERHARFLATVMLHSGVFVGRQFATFAGITHGQKVDDFIEKLRIRRFVTPIELGSTGRTKIFHVHHKPLYAAIGEPDNRNRRRVTIDRMLERLMVLDGVLVDRSVIWLGSERDKRRYFKQRLGQQPPGRRVSAARIRQETKRYRAVLPRWRERRARRPTFIEGNWWRRRESNANVPRS